MDAAFGLGELPDDGPDLPAGCVPYLPCAVDTLLRAVDGAGVTPSDVVVDIGAGAGRAAVILHLLSGAAVVGIEIQPQLVVAARDLTRRLGLARVSWIEGDAATSTHLAYLGSVFFLYCPFSGRRLAEVLAAIERTARVRPLRLCAVDLPLPAVPWLTRVETSPAGELAIYESIAHR